MTRPLPLRVEQPPDDVAVVVRAGVMSAENVRRSAERTFSLYAVYGISVDGVLEGTVQEACRGDRISSYRQVLDDEWRQHERPELTVGATEPPSARLRPDDDERPPEGEGAPEVGQRTGPPTARRLTRRRYDGSQLGLRRMIRSPVPLLEVVR